MNAKVKVPEAEVADKAVLKINTLELRLAVTGADLQQEISRAFALAKSAGRELNLTFASSAP